ncbi:DUF6541 family protein [Microbacterium proteolyticum]|uniref:DUF6541 family protein n=1 Tax=Microbacterium proteolyticum TaxID=1572644 RepID=UPI0035BFE29B
MLDQWGSGLVVTMAAVLILLVPGLIVTWPLRLGLVERAAIAGVCSVLAIGVAGVGGGLIGAAWQPWHPLVPAALGAVLVRSLAPAAKGKLDDSGRRRWIATAWILSAVALTLVAFAAVPDPARVSQTYDNVFHLSAIAEIVAGRDASSLTLRSLIQPSSTFAYYPAGWHALVASVAMTTGASIPLATNATWIAVAVTIWMPGVAWLTQVLLRPVNAAVSAVVALPLSVAFVTMPYGLLTWGTLYPTFLATALLPAAVALPIVVARRARDSSAVRSWRSTVTGSLALGGAVFALAFAQPRVLASWMLLLVPAVVFGLLRVMGEAWRAGGARRRRLVRFVLGSGITLVVAAGAALLIAVRVLGVFDRPIEERLSGPQAQATQSIVDGLANGLFQAWPTGVGAQVTIPSLLLAAAVVTGIVFALRVPRLRWIVVAYAAVIVLFALAAGSDDVIAKLLTGVWYKDRYRLSSLVPVLGVPLAAVGIIGIGERLLARVTDGRTHLRAPAIALSGVVAAVSCVVMMMGGVTAGVGEVFRMPSSYATSEVVSEAQISLLGRLPDLVPEGQRVLGDPWDGSAWSRVYGDREPVFPHVNGIWDPDRSALARDLAAIGDDPRVCAALDRLRVRFVLYSPHALAGGDPAGNLFPGPHSAVEQGVFTPVARDADTVLYRIDQCGPLPG